MLREKVGIYLRITPKGKRFVKPTQPEMATYQRRGKGRTSS